MKVNDCSIVQDLLPLYIEDMLRPDTTAFVEDHLSGCPVCTAALGELKTETAAPIPTPDVEEIRQGDKRVLKGLKKYLHLQHIVFVLAGIIVILHFFPWYDYPGTYRDSEAAFPYLPFTALFLYLTSALALSNPLGIKQFILASILAFALALYAVWPFYKSFTVSCTPTTTYYIFIGFSLVLTVLAEYRIWSKAIKQIKEEHL